MVYDPNTSLIVAASSRQSRFASYDDDGNIVWEPDGESYARCLLDAPMNHMFPSSQRVVPLLRLLSYRASHARCVGHSGWVSTVRDQ